MRHALLTGLAALVLTVPAWGQTAEQKQATIAYVQGLQTPDGGFAASRTSDGKDASTLRATSAAVRALKYLKSEPKDRAAAARFVEKCYDKKSGGFADQPGGKPDLFTTAVGIMAAVALKVPTDPLRDDLVRFLDENAQSFEDIRIAVAGLENLGAKSPKADEWTKKVRALQNAEGTFGKADGVARETGSAAVVLLRLGQKLDNRDAILKAVGEGQRPDGGWGKAGAASSDLETSYRVLRAFYMLKEKPKAPDALRGFIAKCRNGDGGYGPAPGQPSSVGATYFATIVSHWLDVQ